VFIIVTLTYFRHEVPALLLFYAYEPGHTSERRHVACHRIMDINEICVLIQRTCRWATVDTLRRLLYATQQHTAAVRDREEALAVLTRCMTTGQATGRGSSSSTSRE
jgi:hypothetical protein